MLLHTIATLDNLAIALYRSFGNFFNNLFPRDPQNMPIHSLQPQTCFPPSIQDDIYLLRCSAV